MINDKSLSQAEHSFTGTKATTMGITSRQKCTYPYIPV